MTPVEESKAFSRGCLLVFVLLLLLGVAAYFYSPRYWVGFGAICIFWLGVSTWKMLLDRRRLKALLSDCFSSIDTRPILTQTSGYGFPHFTLTFDSEEVMQASEENGEIHQFRSGVLKLYEHHGSKDRPFDVNLAVFPTYQKSPMLKSSLTRSSSSTKSKP